ncbi:ARM repeat-containing protein [Meira miltonrushii]|uniref:ARM repeat-containing protein n=1 Tax=Meira miltonrushii TaxID=1280837 RepID=A0A316VEF5_9BASI|nr:ARM repeat-containing protein [Meira miltonrushii]PWN34673.1 ARM repeat-containing protein [Meira miltonrushii]
MVPPQVERFKKKPLDNNTPLDLLVKLALTQDGQEASIKLQQKLKSQDAAQREAAMDAITPHLHQLAYCRHGNFLAQRAISLNRSLGWTFADTFVKLSLSQYGCHVVQKLLDLGSEDVRELIANELLNEKLEETIASRHAIHIWQKVLDTQWQEAGMRSKIVNTLNEVLRGKWADIALSETGSLICQNLFESGSDAETEECMLEVVDRVCECAMGQWGVWVVQYIIEHAGGEVKKKALDQMLSEATRLSMSQHGQKAIMTAIRARNPSFLAAYIDILCENEVACPCPEENVSSTHNASSRRSVLVDVATCTHGDQIVTQLLTSSTIEQRERIIKTVRKNSVFLKGSKAGLRIYQLCERARAFTGY